MTTIFLSSTQEDAPCASQIRQGLEQAGYTVWCEPDYPTPRDASYPSLIENAILGSAAVVVLWSHRAASFAWTKRHILIAQRFFKLLVPVTLDETALPSTLLVESL
ncbi:MAG TPA: toll/interleukin-1 receptor domain-containing protein, partial [Ktedonobacteraceae bacterium]|nr:toll/interleukin-1 receptor domain-containing protein [Ktedonobacteraceae bacterium]